MYNYQDPIFTKKKRGGPGTKPSHRNPLLHRPQVLHPYRVRFQRRPQRRTFLLILLLRMVHSQRRGARIRQLVRFPPGRLAAAGGAGPSLHIVVESVVLTGPREPFGPGGGLRRAAAGGDFGADVGGEGDFAEEGLQDGEAAADDGEVNFDGPVWDSDQILLTVWEWIRGEGWGIGYDVGLHPDFDADNLPGRVRCIGQGIQHVLSYNGDGTDPALGQRVV